jgi:hypothetical protein
MAGSGVGRNGDGAPTVFLEIYATFIGKDKLSFMTQFLAIWG